MFRLWAREFKNNKMLRDTVVADDSDDTRTHKIFRALDRVCYEFDLGKPIWLDATVTEFHRYTQIDTIQRCTPNAPPQTAPNESFFIIKAHPFECAFIML